MRRATPGRSQQAASPLAAGIEPPPSLWRLVRVFGGIGLTSFGGGRVAYFWHEVARRRAWVAEEDLLEGIAITSLVPGPNFGNLSVFLGQRLRGVWGAALGTLALLAPGVSLMLLLTVLYFSHGQVPAAAPVFRGVGAGAVGLALGSALSVGSRTVRDPAAVVLTALAFVGVALVGLNPLAVIVPLTLAGALWHRHRSARLAREDGR
jgi:chromate transporter